MKNVSHYLDITTKSGKANIDPPMSVVIEVRDDTVDQDDAPEIKTEKLVTTGKTSHESIGVKNKLILIK